MGIMAILATFEASTMLVSKSLVMWDLLSLRLLGWVHGIAWKKYEKFAGTAKTNARLMIDRAPVGQPVPSEYEGG